MYLKLYKVILLFLIFFNTSSLFANKTPLSIYSSQWDADYFNEANSPLFNYCHSQVEIDFIYILNLARISPNLFIQTVLVPYCNNNGFSNVAFEAMNLLNARPKLPMVDAPIYFKKQAKDFLDSRKDTVGKNNFILDKLAKGRNLLAPCAYLQTNSGKAIDVFLQFLTDTSANGVIFRNYFTDEYTDAGIFIQNKSPNAFLAAVYMQKISAEERLKLPLLRDLDVTTFEKKSMIFLNEHPNDSILKHFIKIKKIKNLTDGVNDINIRDINKNSVFISEDEIQKISDSLLSNNISFKKRSFTHYVNIDKSQPKKATKDKSNIDYSYTSSAFGVCFNEMQSDTSLDFYYVGRTNDAKNKYTEVTVIHLTTDPPPPPFPIDSIGYFDKSISLSHVDDYIYSLRNVTIDKLPLLLVKPWKTELEKTRAIFIWIVKNIEYDYVGLMNNRRVYKVDDIFAKRVAVCEGYANLFVYLCDLANLTSYKIHGNVPQGEHAWNVIRIDKKWYLIDATWGLNYFLSNPDVFIQDHFPGTRKWSLLTEPITLKQWQDSFLADDKK